MPDNKTVDNAALTDIVAATDEVTYSGDTADVQLMRPVHVTGAEGSKTVDPITHPFGIYTTQIDEGGNAALVVNEALTVSGDEAHDAPDAGNPVKIGGYASAAAPTNVGADGDRVNAWYLRNGAQVVGAPVANPVSVQVGNATLSAGVVDETGASAVDAFAIGGGTPADSVDSGNPIKIGGKANNSGPSSVAANDRVDAWFDQRGVTMSTFSTGFAAPSADGSSNVVTSALSPGSTGALGAQAANLIYNSSTWDRLRSLGAIIGTTASPFASYTGMAVAGVGPGFGIRADPSNLATAADSVAATGVNGAATAGLEIFTSTTGTFKIEVLNDATPGSNWIAPAAVYDVGAGTWVTGQNLTPTSSKIYLVSVNGMRAVRVRTVTTLGATMSHKWTFNLGDTITLPYAPTTAPVNIQIGDGTRQATVRDTGSSDSLNVAIVDASGNHVTSFGGGTQYTEGDTDASVTGTAVLWEDGSDTLRVASAAKPLPVEVIAGATSGTEYTEGATDATITGQAVMWEDTGDTLRAVSAAKPLPITVTGTPDVVVQSIDSFGSALPAGTNYIGKVRLTDGTLDSSLVDETGASAVDALAVGGATPHDSADSGNPLKIGGKAYGVAPTAVTGNDRVNAWFDPTGRLSVNIGQGNSAGADGVSNNAATLSVGDSIGGFGAAHLGVTNMSYNGSTWDRERNLPAFDTAGSSPRTGLLAAQAPDHRYSSVSLATAANSVQTWDCNGVANALLHIGTSTTGTYAIEVTADGSNWAAADVWDAVANRFVTGQSLTPTANKVYRVQTTGWRTVRVRTVSTLGATMAVIATLAPIPSLLTNAIGVPPPHNFGYDAISIAASYSSTQTSTNVIAGTSGLRIYVPNIVISTGGTTSGRVSIYWGTGAFSAGTSVTLFDGEFAPSANSKPGAVLVLPIPMGGASATGDNLRITTSAAMTVYLSGQAYKA